MSIAENDVRRGVSGGIGSLLPILPMFECEPLGLELPIPMKTGGDRAEWEDSVSAETGDGRWWGGACVVVRGRESRPHGEGGQEVGGLS